MLSGEKFLWVDLGRTSCVEGTTSPTLIYGTTVSQCGSIGVVFADLFSDLVTVVHVLMRRDLVHRLTKASGFEARR